MSNETDQTPQPTTEAPTPAQATTPEKAPLFRGIDAIRSRTGKAAQAIADIHKGFGRLIRHDDPGTASEVAFLKTPFYAAADMMDATALTPVRRIHEITGTIGSEIRALFRTITRPILHPIETLKHPINYLANPGRIISAAALGARHVVNAPGRALNEIVNRGLKRPAERVGYKIPLIGNLLGKTGKALGWIANIPKKTGEWLTRPIEVVDDFVKARQ